jgi:Ca-activated chloride channel family protein
VIIGVAILASLAQASQEAASASTGGSLGGAVRSAAEERFKLWGSFSLADPWFLVLIPLGLACLFYGRSRRGREKARVPSLALESARRSLAQRTAWIVPTLQSFAIVCVAIALARPLRGSVETSSESEGVDIAIVIDRSGSMTSKDLAPDKSRLDVIKEVVHDFAVRRMTDREGAADNIALITFAAYPKLLCPFTLDVDAMTGFIATLKPVETRAEDGTALGVGLAKAVSVLKETSAKSKVVVLLTDGENNIDTITPLAAAQLAAEERIKVYTVFAGRYVYTLDFFGNQHATEREIDTSDLQEIAKRTGGRFYKAKDKTDLEKIYAEIEKLERTKRVEKRYSETFDLYTRFLLPALAFYAAAWLLGSTWVRRLP